MLCNMTKCEANSRQKDNGNLNDQIYFQTDFGISFLFWPINTTAQSIYKSIYEYKHKYKNYFIV